MHERDMRSGVVVPVDAQAAAAVAIDADHALVRRAVDVGVVEDDPALRRRLVVGDDALMAVGLQIGIARGLQDVAAGNCVRRRRSRKLAGGQEGAVHEILEAGKAVLDLRLVVMHERTALPDLHAVDLRLGVVALGCVAGYDELLTVRRIRRAAEEERPGCRFRL